MEKFQRLPFTFSNCINARCYTTLLTALRQNLENPWRRELDIEVCRSINNCGCQLWGFLLGIFSGKQETQDGKVFHIIGKNSWRPFIKWSFWGIFWVSVSCVGVSWWYFIPQVPQLCPEWTWGQLEVALLLLYLEVVVFRLISFFLAITLLFMLEMGFTLLMIYVEMCQSANHVAFILESFTKLEKLLEEFHYLFNFQLITGTFTILLLLLATGFNEVVFTMQLSSQILNLIPLLATGPWLLSVLFTLHFLCKLASRVTNKAKECIWAFRVCPCIALLPRDIKENLIMFYIEKNARPPVVSPGNFFQMGRHMIPTVCFHYSYI